MKTIVLGCVFGCVITNLSFAQTLDSLWSRTFGGGNNDVCYSVEQTSDTGYILAGTTSSFGAGSDDFWLVKTNASGNPLWSRTFGGGQQDRCYSVQQTPDGGYILAGETYSFGAGSDDFWLVKTDENGDSLWSSTFGGSGDECCHSIQQTLDGGYILAGHTYSFAVGLADFWLVKTDEDGDSLWSRSFGRNDTDYCFSVKQTWDGDYYILAGFTSSLGAGGHDFWLVKTNSNGDSLWSRTFGGAQDEDCFSALETWDGYILAGRTSSFGAGISDFWLLKTDLDGILQWNRTYGGSNNEVCFSAWPTMDGGCAMAGSASSFGMGNDDFYLVRTDMDGNLLYSRTFGGGGFERCRGVAQTLDGGYILAGYTTSFGAGATDDWLVKTGLPRPYNLTVYLGESRANPILRWIMPEGGCVIICGTTFMGEIGPPPAPEWEALASPCTPAGPIQWTDPDGIVPYKRYCLVMSHPDALSSAARRLARP